MNNQMTDINLTILLVQIMFLDFLIFTSVTIMHHFYANFRYDIVEKKKKNNKEK